MPLTLKELGENIRSIRKSRESTLKTGRPLYQKELAERADIPAPSLCNIENGKYRNPTWEILSKIARGLDCDIADFFIQGKNDVPASQIALTEMIEMIVQEKLESILGQRK